VVPQFRKRENSKNGLGSAKSGFRQKEGKNDPGGSRKEGGCIHAGYRARRGASQGLTTNQEEGPHGGKAAGRKIEEDFASRGGGRFGK